MTSDADLAFTPADALAQFAFVIEGLLDRHASAQQLSLTQMRLLGVLRDRTPTMNELGRLLELDKSSVSGLVDRAERRGLVAREPSDTDRRAVRVRLSDAGRKLAVGAATSYAADASALLALMPEPDRAELVALISSLLVAHAAAHDVDLRAGTSDVGGAATPAGAGGLAPRRV